MGSQLVPTVAPLKTVEIEKAALQEIARFSPETLKSPTPFPVLKYLESMEDRGFNWAVQPLEDTCEGITHPDGTIVISERTYQMAARHNGRARFTIAHECYHAIQHSHQLKRMLIHFGTASLKRRSQIEAFRDPEWQANTFASFILMPGPAIAQLRESNPLLNRMELIAEMAKCFRVSQDAALVRLKRMFPN